VVTAIRRATRLDLSWPGLLAAAAFGAYVVAGWLW
jgi:hypothetical protein